MKTKTLVGSVLLVLIGLTILFVIGYTVQSEAYLVLIFISIVATTLVWVITSEMRI